MGGVSSAGDECEHCGAEIDGVGFEVGVRGEEACGEAAVSVTEDEGAAGAGECGQEVAAAAAEGAAEGQVLEPAVGLGDDIEAPVHRRNGSTSAGVRRARSAAALRCVRERWKRRR